LTDENAEKWIADHRQKQSVKISESAKPKPVRPLEPKPVFVHPHATAKAPHFNPVIVTETLENIWPYMNPQMMYGTHLGLKGNIKKLLADGDEKALKLSKLLSDLKEKVIRENLVVAKGIYQFFKVRTEGESLIILDDVTETEKMRFTFPRQEGGKQLCLTDFIDPDRIDTVCFFVVTCGDGVADAAKTLLQAGHYFESHGLSAIALEAAEGFSELLHQRIRQEWGIGDKETVTQDDLFKLRYTGKRMSFGYPACPHLEDQKKLWELMRPDETIGVQLSEEYMMYPEASVSALVFHHPQAVYFSVDGEGVVRD
jgi:5-methyltetrahydrofolate--homocysteine methyltransferase